jgi:regulatory protein
MAKITALTVQKKNKERVNIFLDGEYAFSLAMITAAYLRTGQELDEQKIAELQLEDSYERGKEAVMRLLGYRPRSVSEVRRKLKEKEFPETVIERVLTRFQELELLDDSAFARYWIEQRETFRPRGAMALRQELMQKGVSREVVDEALVDLDENSAAYRAAEKKSARWSQLPRFEFNRKVGAFLQRRGFSYSIIRDVSDALWELHGSEEYEQD